MQTGLVGFLATHHLEIDGRLGIDHLLPFDGTVIGIFLCTPITTLFSSLPLLFGFIIELLSVSQVFVRKGALMNKILQRDHIEVQLCETAWFVIIGLFLLVNFSMCLGRGGIAAFAGVEFDYRHFCSPAGQSPAPADCCPSQSRSFVNGCSTWRCRLTQRHGVRVVRWPVVTAC